MMERKTHECERNEVSGVTIFYGPSQDNNWDGWVLENKLIASELDVKSGEAKTVGEELSCSLIAIQFCPFCGEDLK